MVQYYNPENDLALAAGYVNYTAPMAAQRLRQAGALLPMWYGSPGDKVLCFGVNARWWDGMVEAFGLATDIWDHDCQPGLMPSPWGWSLTVKKYFHDLGFGTEVLPTDAEIEKMRQLSHRRTAAELARKLGEALPNVKFASHAIEAADIQQVQCAISQFGGDAMIKFPWSSSGRGLANTRMMGMDKALRMAQESISKQGSVMVEPLHDRVLDFALLYDCQDGKCTDCGTSVFVTDNRGIYVGNLIASEQQRRAQVARHYDINEIEAVRTSLRQLLNETIAPYYNGILGVDMLITKEGILDPMVELNLRKTMGWVANRFSDRYLAEGVRAILRLTPGSAPKGSGPIIRNKKYQGGHLRLTPDNPYFTFEISE